ncbi:unnamed protein product [Sphagnum jensenii]|uniref:t-SNARE coiled-coil homology domain-containing protein n=1 Tax=Sphagnum jensenii TaxID=128206 RepID=A0ABP1AAK6_9BRYO
MRRPAHEEFASRGSMQMKLWLQAAACVQVHSAKCETSGSFAYWFCPKCETSGTTRGQLFDTVEEGGLRASAPYVSSTEIAEQENERGLDTLHDRVNVLKRLTADIHGEVDSHNRLLDGMASAMDASRGIMSGTMNQFKRVFETKSTRTIFTIVGTCVVVFFLVYYLTK